ncbi:four helix bundle protein [bacterium]|nr:four helix bundle protein [bacterium]
MQNYNAKLKNDIRERSYLYALKIIKLIESLVQNRTNKIIGDQLLRSATSIGANIIEAQASPTKKDFTSFLNHALKSANESKFWLGLLRDSTQVSPEKINPLLKEAIEISNILASSILTIRGKRKF